jgi:Na+-transporting methylmalonyl-CoA/oxaloacetate decarboxylase gamma subunit
MSNIVIALQITALGMGLVFAAIILLWWMMAALTSFMADASSSQTVNESDTAEVAPAMGSDIQAQAKAQAAAVAVALALAEEQALRPLTTPPTAIVSAWQLGMRTRQLSEKGVPVSRNPRKIG